MNLDLWIFFLENNEFYLTRNKENALKVHAMARRKIGLKHWSDQTTGDMLRVAKEKEKDKRETLVFKESERKMKNFIKKEKLRNKKPK